MSTKEERFILEAYRQACQQVRAERPPQEAVMHRYRIGDKIGLGEKGVNGSFKLFVKANFVESLEDGTFSLTDGGVRLAKKLLEENS